MADIFDLFKKIETQKPASSSPVEWIVAGLGNPGKEYEGTRHNVGYEALDLLTQEKGFKIDRIKFKSFTGEFTFGSTRVLFLKPTTYMNLSGEAVKEAMDFYKIPPERLLVLVDDIYLAPGKVRIRKKGSAGGHNGLKNIIAHIGSQEFPRVRIGVGEKPNPEYDMAKWVLARPSQEDAQAIREGKLMASKAVPMIVTGDINGAMNSFH